MTTFNIVTRRALSLPGLRALGAFAVLAAVVPAQAAAPHWDRPSCYVHVHDGCYNNQTQPCTDDEYQEFLDGCDTTYPNRPVRPIFGGKKTLKFG